MGEPAPIDDASATTNLVQVEHGARKSRSAGEKEEYNDEHE
jgi:hypothetical protein